MKKKLYQKGFNVVEALIIMVIVGLIGGAGYYVYQNQQDKQPNKKVAVTKQPLAQYTDPTKLYTLSYPKDWVIENGSLVLEGQSAEKNSSISINYTKDPTLEGPMPPVFVTSDKTAAQTQRILEAWGDGSGPEPYKTISINGYKTLHRHIEGGLENEGFSFREDAYLLINKDQSSVSFLITSKHIAKDEDKLGPSFDATDKLEDFKAIVNSVKFLP